jgi:hypothetical protein
MEVDACDGDNEEEKDNDKSLEVDDSLSSLVARNRGLYGSIGLNWGLE